MLTWLSILMFLPVLGFMVCWCCGCDIFDYQFTTSETITDNWTVSSGSWSIPGTGRLVLSGTSGEIVANTTHPSAHPSGQLAWTIPALSWMTNDEIWFQFAYADANNYHYAKVVYNGTNYTHSLWRREAGVDTRLTADVTSAFPSSTVCYDGTYVSHLRGDLFFKIAASSTSGTKVGVKVVAFAGGTFELDRLRWRHVYVTRASCSCRDIYTYLPGCSKCSGTIPTLMQLEISGMANGTCGSCGDLDGTWILTSTALGTEEGACTHGYTFDSAVCSTIADMQIVHQNVVFSSNYELRLRINKPSTGGLIQYAKAFGASLPTCETNGETLTGYSNVSLPECNGTAATITATTVNM